jgi:ABC-2 type transport system ATP-binding protein
MCARRPLRNVVLVIDVSHLTKRFSRTTAVDDVSFRLEPGRVTGFLGPNGAGKSTTMRMILGLDRPTSGHARVDGRPYAELEAPLRSVGAMLDSRAVHPGRTARAHLRLVADTHRIGRSRVEEVLELTGLAAVAGRRAGTFSLGMGQRLGIAAALLGDPENVLLDEPVNGLDPEGVIWVRSLLRQLAAEGRTVLISSHLMSEVAQTADHLVVLGAGRVLADGPLDEVVSTTGTPTVRIASPDLARLVGPLAGAGAVVTRPVLPHPDGRLVDVQGLDAEHVARIAADQGVVLTELTTLERSLEDAYLSLTAASTQYRSAPVPPGAGPAGRHHTATRTQDHR